MTAIVPELPSHQRAAGAGIIGFTSAASLYAGSMLGLLVGSGTVSHDVAFLFMLIINVINIPIGCLGEYIHVQQRSVTCRLLPSDADRCCHQPWATAPAAFPPSGPPHRSRRRTRGRAAER